MSATVTISATGAVSPKSVTIAVGGRVTFVNQHSQFHEMQSDPHPDHTDCPPMNAVGSLAPGQSRQTGVFSTARTCGYHDHGDPDNNNLKGSIVIQ
jgi:plastocyanin